MNETIIEYFDLLVRLIKDEPINDPAGSKINNDTVASEARRKRGTIKKVKTHV